MLSRKSFYLVTISCCIGLLSCSKIEIILKPHPNIELKDYQIRKINGDIASSELDTAVFTYNMDGNPLSIIRKNVGTGQPNYFFYYDSKGRLTNLIEKYSKGNEFEYWHRYYYDIAGRIALDTTFIMGEIAKGPVNYFAKSYTKYGYDAMGRIIKTTEVLEDGLNGYRFRVETKVTEYVYDQYGNLITGEFYDNMINPRRTNRIWMFMDRNYSLNNPFRAHAYNSKGLPVSISYPNGPAPFFKFYGNNIGIAYQLRK